MNYQDNNQQFQQPTYHNNQLITQQQNNQTHKPNQFWKNPDPKKKNIYLILSRVPFYLLLGIIIYIYTNYMLTYVVPQMLNIYDLERFEDNSLQLIELNTKDIDKQYKKNSFYHQIQNSFDFLDKIQNKVVSFVSSQLENASSEQINGFINFLVLHILGSIFVWALYKTITVKPGDIPENWKKNELEEYYVQEEQFIQQLKDNLRQKTMRATRASQNQRNTQNKQQDIQQNILQGPDIQSSSQQQLSNTQQNTGFENPNFKTQQNTEQNNNQSLNSSKIDRSESEVCYDDEEEQEKNQPFIGHTYEEEKDIFDRIKLMHQQNTFKNAGLRFCKKCKIFKPDRTHHCSQCRKCVLRMDHHCQWVDNCLGFYNYKYFLVMLIFATIILFYITSTYIQCFMDSTITQHISISRMFIIALMFYFTLILLLVVTCFTLFHLWLVSNNKTTIEWCEKKKDSITSKYDIGCWGNFNSTLNNNFLLWFCPLNLNLEGDGLRFKVREDYEF